MKPAVYFSLALVALAPAQAQVFRPETIGGAILGGVAGAVIGHNDGRHGWEGAAYGVAGGALLGSLLGQSRERAEYRATQVPVPWRAPASYAYAPRQGWVGYGGYAPVTYRPSYTARGTLLGGLAGAIIGHNDGRHGWEGAAYGAGAGYLLGRWADARARWHQPAPIAVMAAPPAAVAPANPPAQITIINHYYGAGASSSGPSVNGLFGR